MADRLSRGDRLLLIVVLSVAGLVVAIDLAVEWYQAADSSWCDVSSYFSCTRVRESPYAAVAGIPTAVIGVGGFALLAALSGIAFLGRTQLGRWTVEKWIALFAAVGAAIGVGLSLIEVFLIQAVCLLCALGFGLDLGILALALSLGGRADS